jgi:hypothetical protein
MQQFLRFRIMIKPLIEQAFVNNGVVDMGFHQACVHRRTGGLENLQII